METKQEEATQYLNEGLCKTCGGKCCKRLGGAAIPNDIIRNFGGSLEYAVRKALQSSDWVIDWWEGDPRNLDYDDPKYVNRGYYLRPRSKGDQGLRCPSWGGACLLLTPTGCSLPPDFRPYSCRTLEPVEDGNCILHGTAKQGAALAWIDHHALIESVS